MKRDEALMRLEKENSIQFEEIEKLLKHAGVKDISFLHNSSFSRK